VRREKKGGSKGEEREEGEEGKEKEEREEEGGEGKKGGEGEERRGEERSCLLYTSPSPRDPVTSRMPSSA
jgi:hypothetical protein